MKILKSSFHFQPSDDLFPIDKFRQIPEFIKITANLKRRFVMVTTPDILTALSLVMRLEPIGNMLWQGQIEGNQFQIIPDIFHPMNEPGYILIRYVDADTVTLIEFEEHMMGVAGFDSIVDKTEETDEELFQDIYPNELSKVDESTFNQLDADLGKAKAERVGDKYVFNPEICSPGTETCGECIHGVCCEKAKIAKSQAKELDKGQPEENEDIPGWKYPIDRIKKLLWSYRIEYKREDKGIWHYLKYENGYKEYRVSFGEVNDLEQYYVIFTDLSEGKLVWEGRINSYNKLYELELAITNRIKPMEDEEC